MSQALLMRIIALENKIAEIEKRLESPELILWSEINDPRDFSPFTELVETPKETEEPVHEVNASHQRDWPSYYHLSPHGVGWFHVIGPNGQITEKGLRRHEAQALADDLNGQAG